MTNLNDTEAELGLAVSINNEWNTSNTAAGAGANANSKADMMSFVGHNTLAELVWSPRTGLAIKFAEKKPRFLWEVGSSDVRFLQSEDTRDEKHISEYHSVASLAMSHVSGEVKSSSSVEIPGSTCNVHTNSVGPQNEGTADPDTLSKRLFEDRMTSGVDGPGSNSRPPLEVEATDQCEPQEHLESGNLEVDDGEMEKLVICGGPFLENPKGSISKNTNIAEQGDSLPREDIDRSLYCQNNNEEHEVESYGGIESCNSANSLTKVKRKSSFEQQLIFRSKRIKKQADECTVRKDSSFMSWISNMSKGLKNHENYERKIGICEESRSFPSRKTGFQNVFQSLYLQDSRAHKTIAQMENNSICSSKERVITTKLSHESLDCLEIKEKEADGLEKHISLYERITREAPKLSHESLDCLEIKEKEADGLEKHISLYERITREAPKEMFDTIRRLRLSRTDILKWTNSQLSFANLDGYFLRLRLAKWEEGAGGSRYYVACITGLQGENPWKGLKQPVHVKVGGVECFVESQYVSNCDFLEDELVAWWQKTSINGGTPVVEDLKSKLVKRRTLGL